MLFFCDILEKHSNIISADSSKKHGGIQYNYTDTLNEKKKNICFAPHCFLDILEKYESNIISADSSKERGLDIYNKTTEIAFYQARG